jgi:hypothetical protein
MAVLVVADIKGGTVEQYEAVSRAIGFRDPDFEPPRGLLSHTAAIDGDGVLIVDVWESTEDFQRLMADTAPALQGAGVPPFEPRIYPLHSYFQGQGTSADVLLLIESPGFSTDDYERVTARMDAHRDGGASHPAVFHTSGVRDGGGMVFADAWDSPESFGRFAEQQLGPAAESVGVDTSQFEPRFVPVHYHLTGKS